MAENCEPDVFGLEREVVVVCADEAVCGGRDVDFLQAGGREGALDD